MTLRELILDMEARPVAEAIARLYRQADDEALSNGVTGVLTHLRQAEPEPLAAGYTVQIERDPAEDGWNVFWRLPGMPEAVSAVFSSWQSWLSIGIPASLREEMPPAEIAAHCLWEMTFCGWTPELQEQKREGIRERLR